MVPPGKSWWHIGEQPLSVHWNYWTLNHGLYILHTVRLWILVNVKMHSIFNGPPKIRAINCFSYHILKRATTKQALILVMAWHFNWVVSCSFLWLNFNFNNTQFSKKHNSFKICHQRQWKFHVYKFNFGFTKQLLIHTKKLQINALHLFYLHLSIPSEDIAVWTTWFKTKAAQQGNITVK